MGNHRSVPFISGGKIDCTCFSFLDRGFVFGLSVFRAGKYRSVQYTGGGNASGYAFFLNGDGEREGRETEGEDEVDHGGDWMSVAR